MLYSLLLATKYAYTIFFGDIVMLIIFCSFIFIEASPHTSALKVALIEGMSLESAARWDPSPDQLSNRVSSITPASKSFLEKIGVWEHVYPERVQEYDNMHVWDGVSGSRIQFDSFHLHPVGQSMAYMTENINLQHALLSYLSESAATGNSVTIFDNTKVEEITPTSVALEDVDLSSWPSVRMSNGSTVYARLLIGADGVNSPVRSYAGIESRGWDYGQHGLVATLTMEWNDRQNVAWQRFLPTGPIALLPMPDGKASLVWSTTPKLAAHLKSLSPEAFCTLVNAAFRLDMTDLNYLYTRFNAEDISAEFEWRDGLLPMEDEGAKFPLRVAEVQEGSRASFPLRMRHCDSYVAPRVALVGDAAHSTHPLAGQGLNLGQGDVATLSSVLEKAVVRGADIGDEVVLQEYWAERYPVNHVMLGVIDKLQKLYCTDAAPIVALRSVGLDVVNSLDWVKTMIMKQATGV